VVRRHHRRQGRNSTMWNKFLQAAPMGSGQIENIRVVV
jgi:hypothetical protein